MPRLPRSPRLLLATVLVAVLAPLAPTPSPRGQSALAAGTVRWGYYVTYAADSLTSLRANVDNLTHVSPYFYGLNGDGTIDARNEQPEVTSFLRSRGVTIVPMIKNNATYDAFHHAIDTPAEQDRIVAALVALVAAKGYDGIHIDFEGVNADDRPLLTDFMRRLHERLSAARKLTTMAVAAKASDVKTGWGGSYDYAALARYTDLAVVMAYDFNWVNDPTPGPVAPVPWVRGVARFAAQQFGPGKTILGVPFYGFDWNVAKGPPAKSVRMAEGPALAQRPGATAGYSATDEANWVRYTDAGGDAHEVWYEDERSLSAKLGIVTELGLVGFGAWRIGHENEAAWAAVRRLNTPATRVAPVPDTADQVYFAQTGHIVSGALLRYWRAYGGLEQFGLPRTEEFEERSPYDNTLYRVQYFERARFEYHPENAPPYDVLLGLLGRDFHRLDPAVEPKPGASYFGQTGHNLGGPFRDYWLSHGGLFVSGLPLSEEFVEISPDDGKPYTVQYFERARYEYHPENVDTPHVVLLGLLGNRVLRDKGWIP